MQNSPGPKANPQKPRLGERDKTHLSLKHGKYAKNSFVRNH